MNHEPTFLVFWRDFLNLPGNWNAAEITFSTFWTRSLTFMPSASRSQLRCFDCFEGRLSRVRLLSRTSLEGTAVKLLLVSSLCACLNVSDTVWQQHSFSCTQGETFNFPSSDIQICSLPNTNMCCLCKAHTFKIHFQPFNMQSTVSCTAKCLHLNPAKLLFTCNKGRSDQRLTYR